MTKADIIARFPRLQVRGEGNMVHVCRDRREVVFCSNVPRSAKPGRRLPLFGVATTP
jgi:hypothetical protein